MALTIAATSADRSLLEPPGPQALAPSLPHANTTRPSLPLWLFRCIDSEGYFRSGESAVSSVVAGLNMMNNNSRSDGPIRCRER